MKKEYVAPELEKILFDINDIITHSLATGNQGGNDNENSYNPGDDDDGLLGIEADGVGISVFGIRLGG